MISLKTAEKDKNSADRKVNFSKGTTAHSNNLRASEIGVTVQSGTDLCF